MDVAPHPQVDGAAHPGVTAGPVRLRVDPVGGARGQGLREVEGLVPCAVGRVAGRVRELEADGVVRRVAVRQLEGAGDPHREDVRSEDAPLLVLRHGRGCGERGSLVDVVEPHDRVVDAAVARDLESLVSHLVRAAALRADHRRDVPRRGPTGAREADPHVHGVRLGRRRVAGAGAVTAVTRLSGRGRLGAARGAVRLGAGLGGASQGGRREQQARQAQRGERRAHGRTSSTKEAGLRLQLRPDEPRG